MAASKATEGASDAARRAWNRQEWWGWVCDRAIEHLQGDVYWFELDGAKFALLHADNATHDPLRQEIVRLRDLLAGLRPSNGSENGHAESATERNRIHARLAQLLNELLA